VYLPGPQLRAMPAPGGGTYAPARPARARPTVANPLRSARPKTEQRNQRQVNAAGVPLRGLAMFAGAALCALAVYALVSAALEWVQIKADDFQYGRPRTMQMDAFVGHNELEGVPSHFIAMNLNRRVTVIELPGGDTANVRTIVGPYLFGHGEDLTPVQANIQDVNGDTRPDLLVAVKNEQLIYLNDGENFKLMSPEEAAALQKSLETPASEGTGATVIEEAGK
jgi:hypothetical protein